MADPDPSALTGSEFALSMASAEQLFRALFDYNEDGFALVEVRFDQHGRAVDACNIAANPALQRHTGLVPVEIRGRWSSEILPRMEQPWLDAMGEAVRTGQAQRLEHYQQDTGRWYEVINFPFEGNVIGQFIRDVTDRHTAAEALLESQARFQMLAENSSDLVFSTVCSTDPRFSWVSPSCLRMLGWPAEDLSGKPVLEHVFAEDQPALIDALQRAEQGGKSSAEVRLTNADGSVRWFSLALHRVPDPRSGEPVVVCGARQVDAEHRARERLRRNEARLKATLDSLIDPHLVLQAVRDRQGSITDFVLLDANEAACRDTSMRYAELVGSRLLDLAQAPTGPLLPALKEVVESGDPLVLDDYVESTPASAADAPHRWYDLRAVKVDDGLSYSWRDVTERYQGRARVFASEERFRLAVSSVPTGIAVLDLMGRFDFVNPAFCTILERGPQWLLRRDMQQVLYPGEFAKLRHMIGLLTADSTPAQPVQQAQQRFVTASGAPVQARHTVALLHGSDGRPVGLLSHVQPLGAGDAGPQEGAKPIRPLQRTTVLVTADDRGTFPAISATALLAQRPEFVTLPWASATDLRSRLLSDTPEVVVLLTSPGVAGPAQLARMMTDLEAAAPNAGLVVLSGNNRTQVESLLRQRTGPSAFLPVAFLRSADVLSQAITTVAQGMGAFDPSAVDALIGRNEPPSDSRLGRLSERELEVLALLAEGLDNQAIAQRLYVSVKACENYIGSVFRKLGLNAEEGTNRRVRAALAFLGER